MSTVLGVYVHLHEGRYRLLWALVVQVQVIDHGELRAPTEPEDRSLSELETRFSDLLDRLLSGHNVPERLALRLHDVRRISGGMRDEEVRIPAHAEGVVIAVAGRRRVAVVGLSGQKLGGIKGVKRKGATLQPPISDADLSQAAVAASLLADAG